MRVNVSPASGRNVVGHCAMAPWRADEPDEILVVRCWCVLSIYSVGCCGCPDVGCLAVS